MDKFHKLFIKEMIGQARSGKESKPKPEIVNGFASQRALDIFRELTDNLSDQLAPHKRYRYGFIKRNKERWKKGLDKFESLLLVNQELGADFSEFYLQKAINENDDIFIALAFVHSRGCLVAREIFTLMENGFADGALARWRTLHELATVAIFLSKHDKKVAKKYIEHENITQCKGMIEFNKYADELGQQPFSEEEVEAARAEITRLENNYGKDFSRQYGWAKDELNNTNFEQLEKSAGLSHLRPYYKWSLKKVHAGHVSNYADLGMSEAQSDFLLVGSSNSGLTDPAHLTAISLSQIAASFFLLRLKVDSLIYVHLIELFEDDIGNSFIEIENNVI